MAYTRGCTKQNICAFYSANIYSLIYGTFYAPIFSIGIYKYIKCIFLVIFVKKGTVTFPTIVVLGPKVESNVVSIVQFIVLISNLASDLPYIAFIDRKTTSKFSLPALFESLAFRLLWMDLSKVNGNSLSLAVPFTLYS